MAITLAYLSHCIYLFSSYATVENFIEFAWLTNHGISRDLSFPLSFPNFLITDINDSSMQDTNNFSSYISKKMNVIYAMRKL